MESRWRSWALEYGMDTRPVTGMARPIELAASYTDTPFVFLTNDVYPEFGFTMGFQRLGPGLPTPFFAQPVDTSLPFPYGEDVLPDRP